MKSIAGPRTALSAVMLTAALLFTATAAAAPDTVTRLTSPSGRDVAIQKAFFWRAVPDATWYEIYVTDGNLVFTRWYTADDASCERDDSCFVHPRTDPIASAIGESPGDKIWWIRAWNPSGYSPWSVGRRYYTGAARYPGVVDRNVEPLGSRFDSPSTFRWKGVAGTVGTTWYRLYVQLPGGIIDRWYTEDTADCGLPNNCDVAVDLGPLNVGSTVTWWVQAWSSGGYGQWSAPFTFRCTDPSGTCS